MIKQCMVAALLAATGAASFLAIAAREEHTFEVSVLIPTRAFYVIPSEPDWIQRQQILPWDVATSRLGSLRKYFDVRHDTSAIEARLELQPYLSNGHAPDNIALRVRFNGVELSHAVEPRLVVSAADAAVGSRVLLEIEPQQPPGGYRAGDYYGNVLLLFNARAPGG
ncbi:CS1 type fimbrial major subunit [Pseudomonas frederiksbergensis]|uniref:Fimbrial assembly protein n=1 Tax=Pseudomonas frederiksbergensis TaxID=104087 RepID=A0A423K9R8_9PSED|nr:CS1 type fimbrial major subunit [Pseudomonas frederiksbergensis]RON43017.1 fimbrial assembly protein [Pseudomonas frederiksbergensis]RON48638.1 fimbrial assembly protein [Pseudomonas frederiksbergensis]